MVALWLVDAALITMLPARLVQEVGRQQPRRTAMAAAEAVAARWSELYSGPDVL